MSVGSTNPMNNGGRTRGKPDSVIRCSYSTGQPPNYYLPNKKPLPATKLHDFLQDIISIESRKKICKIIEDVSTLTDIEKLFVYLQLPTGKPLDFDPLKIPQNPLGSRFEVGQTITWIQTHFEEDASVSLPKQEVYDDYMSYCSLNNMKLLSMADFGKVMKQAFPDVRPRRLGTRGNSRYCYAGLQKKMNLPTPMLPDLGAVSRNNEALDDTSVAAWCLVKEWAEKTLKHPFKSVVDLAYYLISHSIVDNRSIGALSIITAAGQGTGIVPGSSKQNDARIQLGLKLQERERQQEEKRKHQEPNADLQSPKTFKNGKPSGKKVRLGRSNSCAGKSSGDLIRWPPKGEPPRSHTAVPDMISETVICPKVPSGLPSSSSHSCANVHTSPSKVGKVPIPRLSGKTATSTNNILIGYVPPTQFTPVPKYKPIQPKPPVRDTKDSLLKRRSDMETLVSRKEGKFEQEEVKTDQCNEIELSEQNDELNLDQDIIEQFMNEENEKLLNDEMDSIFREKEKTESERHKPEDLSKLRTILAESLKSDNRTKPLQPNGNYLMPRSLEQDSHALKIRRVSFEPVSQGVDGQLIEQHANGGMVPQSPNTRRRSFNFQPIDPGCMSPDASPFMSPRGTPCVKSRHNSGQSGSYVTTRGTPMSTLSDASRTTLDSTPFVSPLTTPIPIGSRSRHVSTQDFRTLAHSSSHPQLAIGKRCRNTSGGIMAHPRTLFTNTAPQSPSVLSGEQEKTHFNFGEPAGRVRSRHNSAGGNPQSPTSAPQSPSVSGPPLMGDGNESMLRSILRDSSIRTDSRRRHWSAFAESQAAFYMQEGGVLGSQQSILDESTANASGLANRCQSVPLYQMIQAGPGLGVQEFSNPSTPAVGQQFDIYNNPVNYHTPEESVHNSCAGTPVGQQSDLVLDPINASFDMPSNAESSQSLDVDLFNRLSYESAAPPLVSSRSQPATPLPGAGGFLLDVGPSYQQSSASHSYPSTPVNVPNVGEQFLRSSSSQQLLFTGAAPAPGIQLKSKSESMEQSQLKVDLDEGYDFEAESDFNQLVNEIANVSQDEDHT